LTSSGSLSIVQGSSLSNATPVVDSKILVLAVINFPASATTVLGSYIDYLHYNSQITGQLLSTSSLSLQIGGSGSAPTLYNNSGILEIHSTNVSPGTGNLAVLRAEDPIGVHDLVTLGFLEAWAGDTAVTTLGTVTTGVWQATTISTGYGGTGLTSYNLGDILYASATNVLTALPGNITTTRKYLLQAGNGTISSAPSWTQILSTDINNTTFVTSVSGTANNITSTGGLTPVLSISTTYVGQSSLTTLGTISTGIWNATIISPTYGGTGVNNGSSILTLGGNTQFSGAYTFNATLTNNTSVTFPTSGTLAITASPTFTGTVTLPTTNIGGNLVFTPTTTYYIQGLANPVNPQDAATKAYVDASVQGLTVKPSVIAATTTALPAYTYNNGTSGVGATITFTSVGVFTIDGVSPAVGQNVLIKNETSTNAPYNGIYIITNAGSVSTSAVLTRSIDMNAPSEFNGAFTFVESGTVNVASGWVCIVSGTIVVGTTNITFTQFSGAGELIAGTGITITGNTISVNASQTQITAIGTLTTGTWNATAISPVYGGTGLTSYNLGDTLYASATNTLATLAGNITTTRKYLLSAGNGTTASAPSWTQIASTDLNNTSFVTSVSGTTNQITVTGTLTPTLSISTGYVGQTSITTLGTISTGTWQGSVIGPTYGGTGVNNGSSTLTLSGNVSFTGAYTLAVTLTSITAVTFPTSGTLAVTGGPTFTGNVKFSTTASISAAGTTQGTATAITSDINEITTATSGQGVILPTAVAGMKIDVINATSVSIYVYPATGAAIGNLGTNAGLLVTAFTTVELVAATSTVWGEVSGGGGSSTPTVIAAADANYSATVALGTNTILTMTPTTNRTLTLANTTPVTGAQLLIVNNSAGAFTIAATAGTNTILIQPSQGVWFVYDGTRWEIKPLQSQYQISTQVANYTLTAFDQTVLFNTGASSLTASLPTAASVPGLTYNIKKIDSGVGNVAITPNGSDLIDGQNTVIFIIAEYDNVELQSDGTSWWLL
jgi:hypothetical protein